MAVCGAPAAAPIMNLGPCASKSSRAPILNESANAGCATESASAAAARGRYERLVLHGDGVDEEREPPRVAVDGCTCMVSVAAVGAGDVDPPNDELDTRAPDVDFETTPQARERRGHDDVKVQVLPHPQKLPPHNRNGVEGCRRDWCSKPRSSLSRSMNSMSGACADELRAIWAKSLFPIESDSMSDISAQNPVAMSRDVVNIMESAVLSGSSRGAIRSQNSKVLFVKLHGVVLISRLEAKIHLFKRTLSDHEAQITALEAEHQQVRDFNAGEVERLDDEIAVLNLLRGLDGVNCSNLGKIHKLTNEVEKWKRKANKAKRKAHAILSTRGSADEDVAMSG
ncbi:hypothetical protein C8J57DRAFT_1262218 [Mycena rebaudengoi]|nr:hypothetical protein C8J57DRAFT_1262218 [Mycena rebaudengoi]